MMKQFFDDMVANTEARLLDHHTARLKFTLENARLCQRLYSGTHRLAWCGVCAPFDLLNAMGINSCFVEFLGAVLAASGSAGQFLEEAEHVGFLADSCGWHRAVIGAAAKEMMPIPDVMIATSSPCTGGVAAVEHLARTFDCPLYVLAIPPDDSESSVRYLADQIRSMVDFVSAHTGEVLDEDRLRYAMNKTNEAREAAIEMFHLAQRTPSPARAADLRNFGITLPLFLGTETAVEIAQAYRDEFAARLERGISGVPDERFRLIWLQEAIQFRHPLIKMLEENYQAAIVIEELDDIYWEPIDAEDPFVGLARRTIAFPFNGQADRRLKHIKKLVQAYKIDGAINPCHWGCRQGTGARGLIGEALKELDVPVINLEVDCADSRNFSEGQLRTRLEAFIEVLGSRPGRRSTN
ncbi:MAG: 2-hydroxyacyl-CoA dehydratase family protein [Deltaproteobacteria bacterium]|nr:2-hydroxyacyl-CoA dehydratase family protein [Deltaproteobacteria bacterium]